jgi:NADH-quinone oxidoreductase subunit H
MAEYASMFAVSGIAILLFLGGWHTGLTPGQDLTSYLSSFLGKLFNTWDLGFFLGNLINVFVFIAKGWLLVSVMMWVRWTLPRLRIDQVMETCLKYLLPISCVLLLGVSFWQVAMPGFVLVFLKIPVGLLCLALTGYGLYKLVTTPSRLPFPGVNERFRQPGAVSGG